MAPRTRKQVAKRRTNNVPRDVDGMEENGHHQIEQEREAEVSQQPIQKQGMPPSTKRATASRDASSVFQDKQKMMENRHSQNYSQASREQVMGLKTRKEIGNQIMSRRLLEETDHMEGDELHEQNQNEEELEFSMARQTNSRQVMAPRSQRSTVNRRPNYVFSDEHEMEEGGQQENEEQSNLEVAEALKNALQILAASSTRRTATSQRFQDTNQREENRQWQSRRHMQPSTSQQVSMMPPTTRKATRNHIGYNTLRDEIQIEGDEEQPEFQRTEQVMAPSTQRSTAKRKLDDMLLDEDEIDGRGHQGNGQSNLGITQDIENALKILMAPSTRRAITNLNSNSRFRDTNQMKEKGQLQSRKQLQPEFSHQASIMASKTRKATTVQSGYHRLQEEDQLERDREDETEEQPQFQATRQTKDKQVMTRSTRRSTAGVNHGLLDEDEIEEHGQEGNEKVSDMDVSQAIENALKILMTPSARKETTNENSHCGFQDRHQVESRQQHSRQQLQLPVSQQASISAVMPPRTQNTTGNQSRDDSLQDEDQMEGGEEQQTEVPLEIEMALQTNNKKGTTRKPRGPTLLRDIWGRDPDEEGIKIHFNKRGQPVGPNKKKFTGFLGTLARNGRYAPLDIDDWRKVPKENKDAMIKLVKERFEVPEGMEHWILLSIGRKRNDWRARVKSQYLDPTLPIEDQIHKIPPRVTKEQWKNLCSYWANEDKMEECARNKANRLQSLMHKTTGKLSFAEIEEEMRERLGRSPTRVEMFAACFTRHDGNPSSREVAVALDRMKEYQSKLPKDSPDPVRPDDTFAKVIGNDPPGKIRMLGLGANQSDFWGATPSRGTCYKMVMEHQAKMAQMEEKMEQFTKLVGSLQEKLQLEQNPNNVQTKQKPLSPGQSSNSNIVGHNLQVGDSVVLKSLFDQKKILAKGCLESVNPDHHVGGRRLGSNWYGVHIAVPIEWDEDLIRPYSNFSTIGDAIGICVAWPHHLVTSEDNQE